MNLLCLALCSSLMMILLYWDLGVSNYWTGKWTGTMEWAMEVSKSSFHCNIKLYCVVIYLLTYS